MTLGAPDKPVTDDTSWLLNKVKTRLGKTVNKVLKRVASFWNQTVSRLARRSVVETVAARCVDREKAARTRDPNRRAPVANPSAGAPFPDKRCRSFLDPVTESLRRNGTNQTPNALIPARRFNGTALLTAVMISPIAVRQGQLRTKHNDQNQPRHPTLPRCDRPDSFACRMFGNAQSHRCWRWKQEPANSIG